MYMLADVCDHSAVYVFVT